jgi:tetratricopeptide (TPR) repeat protein
MIAAMLASRLVLVLSLALSTIACRTAPGRGPGAYTSADRAEALAGLPERKDPPLALDDDDDLARARAEYEALLPEAPGRVERRAELWKAYALQIEQSLADHDLETAADTFGSAIGMWTSDELADESRAAAGLGDVAPLAEKLWGAFSSAGQGTEAITTVAVLLAAHTITEAEAQTRLDEITSYADDLEIAQNGPGAAHARPIKMLEKVTAQVASPRACRQLAKQYLDRQALWQAAATKPDLQIAGAQSEDIQVPALALIRAYARMGQLDKVGPVLDSLAGQRGDNPELRALITEMLGPKGKAMTFVQLAVSYTDQARGGEPDLATAHAVCLTAAARFPDAPEPRKCLGIIAAQQNLAPLARRHLEAAHKLDPHDLGAMGTLAAVYIFQIRDAMQGERLTAATAIKDQAIAFVTQANEVWRAEKAKAGKAKGGEAGPGFEPGQDEIAATYGEGLYALGEIDGALEWMAKANAISPNAGALETMGTIYLRRGRYADAVAAFEKSAALPRETPVLKRIDEARLLRLAADARALSGDRVGAEVWWKAAAAKWRDILGSGLTDGQKILSLIERGRVLWALGERAEAQSDFEGAVDNAGRTASGSPSAFSDVIAFRWPRGGLAPALDAYHRGASRVGITDYFKIYTSIWVVAAARLRSAEPDPLAMEYLGSRKGSRWYHLLARYAVGQLPFPALLEKADTRGKRAEAFFYEGLARYAAGDREAGDHYLHLTLATDMMGFFEYEMALVILREGPPTR